jgi:hypothetical protein
MSRIYIKKKGWYNLNKLGFTPKHESYRHQLAGKGIKTGRNVSLSISNKPYSYKHKSKFRSHLSLHSLPFYHGVIHLKSSEKKSKIFGGETLVNQYELSDSDRIIVTEYDEDKGKWNVYFKYERNEDLKDFDSEHDAVEFLIKKDKEKEKKELDKKIKEKEEDLEYEEDEKERERKSEEMFILRQKSREHKERKEKEREIKNETSSPVAKNINDVMMKDEMPVPIPEYEDVLMPITSGGTDENKGNVTTYEKNLNPEIAEEEAKQQKKNKKGLFGIF